MEEAREFGERLRELRIAAGLSQRELAERVGVSFTYISKLESGAMRLPSEPLIEKLAITLGADEDELLTLAGKVPADILEMLKDKEVRHLLRSPRVQRKFRASTRKGGFAMKLRGIKLGRLARVATAVSLVVAIGASLWLSAPPPARAFNVALTVSNSPISDNNSYLLGEKVTLVSDLQFDPQEYKDFGPDTVVLQVSGPEGFSKSLPIDTGNYTFGANEGVPGSLSVGVTWDAGIVKQGGYSARYGYSYGGYGYGGTPGKVRYSVQWTPPYQRSTPPTPPPPALPGSVVAFNTSDDWNDQTIDLVLPQNVQDQTFANLSWPKDMIYDGTNLFMLVQANYNFNIASEGMSPRDIIVKTERDGSYVGWFVAPGQSGKTEGLALIGTVLYAGVNEWDNQNWSDKGKIYKYDTATDGPWTAVATLANLNPIGGLATDGTSLFVAFRDQLMIKKYNKDTGAVIKTIDLNAGNMGFQPLWGFDTLTYDGTKLYGAQGETIIDIDPATGAKGGEFHTGKWNTGGLAFVTESFSNDNFKILYTATSEWPGKVLRSAKPGDNPQVENTPIGSYNARLNVTASGTLFQTPNRPFTITKLSAAPSVTISAPLPNFSVGAGNEEITVSGSINDPSISQVSVGIALPDVIAFTDNADNAAATQAKWQHSAMGGFNQWMPYSNADLWHRSTNKNHNGGNGGSWRYADSQTGNFETMGQPNAGVLRTVDPIAIGNDNTLEFWTWYDTELDFYPDRKFVEASTDGVNWQPIAWLSKFFPPFVPPDPNITQQMWNAKTSVPAQAWSKVTVPLDQFAGESIYLRFRFDTMDNINNFGEGWYIDDVTVSGAGFLGTTVNLDANLAFSTTFTVAEGANTISVSAARTNYQPALTGTASVSGSMDTVGPTIILNPVTTPTNQQYQTISGTVVESNFDRLEIKNNGDVKYSTTVLGQGGTYSQPLLLSEGTNNIMVVAKDKVGLTSNVTATIKLDTTGPAFESAFSGSTTYRVSYKTGEVSARPGDWFFIALKVSDVANQVASVKLAPPNEDPSQWPSAMLKANVPAAVIDSWGFDAATKSAMNYVLPMQLPNGLPAGNYSWTVKAWDNAGNMSELTVLTTIVTTLQAFNIYLMPDWNLVSTPLIPTNTSIATLTSSVNATGLFDRVWYYDASQAGTSNAWKFYDPAAGGDLTTLETGKGYWFKMKDLAAFQAAGKVSDPMATGLPNTPAPVKMTIAGQVLAAGNTPPPAYAVPQGWNLVGLHAETDSSVPTALTSVTVPQQKWGSIFEYQNYIDFPMQQNASPTIILGRFSRLTSSSTMQPGRGFWLYMVESGTIVP